MSTRFFVIDILLLFGCSEARVEMASPRHSPSEEAEVIPRGKRMLGFGVTEGVIGYEKAFGHAKSAGIQFVELAQQWDEVERSPGKFTSPFLKVANAFYPASGTSIVLSINPIDTSSLRVPEYLRDQPLDSDEVIRSFNKFVDFVIDGLPEAEIIAVSIGNEVDGWLGDDAEQWSRYARFFAAVSQQIRAEHPGIPVGVKTTWSAIVDAQKREIGALNRGSDAIMVTYYPLNGDFTVRQPNIVSDELGQLVEVAEGKPVFLLETGYPSGSANQSSEQQQAEFIDAVFAAWDEHADAIQMINFVWLCDMSKADVKGMTQYYAVKTPAFASFLSTLGLKTHQGKDKQAFLRVSKCAQLRGWK